jgi:hypothetical protein
MRDHRSDRRKRAEGAACVHASAGGRQQKRIAPEWRSTTAVAQAVHQNLAAGDLSKQRDARCVGGRSLHRGDFCRRGAQAHPHGSAHATLRSAQHRRAFFALAASVLVAYRRSLGQGMSVRASNRKVTEANALTYKRQRRSSAAGSNTALRSCQAFFMFIIHRLVPAKGIFNGPANSTQELTRRRSLARRPSRLRTSDPDGVTPAASRSCRASR